MLIHERQSLNLLLETTCRTLDIPDHIYEDATRKYHDIGEFLAAEDSALHNDDPQIYPQGSFRLGTVVLPLTGNCEYDIDLVCQLDIDQSQITKSELKDKVGRRLLEREDLASIVKPSRRCWVLEYPSGQGMPGFHMDVLPSINNPDSRPTGILLTDTKLTRWQKSNPIAYAAWFRKRMEVVLNRRRRILADAKLASIEDVPEWRVKTPLQRAVQILKRHRDIHFQSRPDEKPISIIITTLAALAYDNQEDIFDALTDIAKKMPDGVARRDGKWWIPNPVAPDENFADKWNEYPERQAAFMQWLGKVQRDFTGVSQSNTVSDGLVMLKESMGDRTMTKVAAALGVQLGPPRSPGGNAAIISISGATAEKPVVEKLRAAAAASSSASRPWLRK